MKSTINRNYKDGIFRSLFNDKNELLELYNALTGSSYPKGTKIEIVTLDNIIFNGIKNDLAFIIDNHFVVLIEQQSTMSPNFPLRLFCYLAKVYEKIAKSGDIYSTKLIELPVPELYVFYNGLKDEPLEQVMKLSDAFKEKSDIITVEAIVKVINVNYAKGAELLERCRTLQKYSLFVHRIRELYLEFGDIDAAVKECVREFIESDILRDFLMEHRGDVMSVLEVNLTMEEQIAIRVRDMCDDLKDEWRAEVRAEVESEVRAEVESEVRDEMKSEVRAEVKSEVRDEVKLEVRDEMKSEVRAEVESEISEEKAMKIAANLKTAGLATEVISEATGLTVAQIDRL